jgi:hypothetical protein
MSNSQPVLASYFFGTELRYESHPVPLLTIVFQNENPYLLIKNNNTNLKAITSVLQAKLKNPIAFQLKTTLLQDSQSQTPQKMPAKNAPPGTPSLGEDELVLREPAIGYILEKFDGKLMA